MIIQISGSNTNQLVAPIHKDEPIIKVNLFYTLEMETKIDNKSLSVFIKI